MKVVQFTIPVAENHSVIVQEDVLSHFYPHLHRHKEMQVMWIMEGEGTMIAGNNMQRFKPGEIYIIGANQPHVFKNDPGYFDKRRKKQVRSLMIFFNTEGLLAQMFNLPEMKSIKKFLALTPNGLQADYKYYNAITKAINEVKNKNNVRQVTAFIDLLHLFAGLKNWKMLSMENIEYAITDSEGLRMNNIYQYTMKNYTNNISLDKIASVAHMTPQAFCRYFKKHTLKTFVTFLNEVRISEACKRMIASEYDSIASIAYQSGFGNTVTFNRVFKQVTGVAPKIYIRQFREQSLDMTR
ncbi:MAG TPA: AraC family transcriptional regulator [Puia sp.]|nr:AraC family transcriptional regulator [Puia sp.]